MSSAEGIQTPLPQSLFARLTTAARYAISGVAPQTWFGPQQPLTPTAPPEVKGRQFDYVGGVDWTQFGVSPAAGAFIGIVVMAMRTVTTTPVGKSS